MTSFFDQASYQVRFEWGTEGLGRLAASDVVIVVDVLRFSSTLVSAVADGPVPLEAARTWSGNGAAVSDAAAATGAVVLVGGLRNASAVADAVVRLQDERQQRTFVTVIAAGERATDGALRFAVEDQLGAGAVIAALTDRGIDHSSPEAAAADAAFRGLRNAVRHLLSGSGSGRELAAGDPVAEQLTASGITPVTVREAAVNDDSTVVPVLQGGSFIALG